MVLGNAPRLLAALLSLAVHGAVFAGALGHGAGSSSAPETAQSPTELRTAPEIVEIAPPVTVPKDQASPTLPTHTHDYPVAAAHDATPHDEHLPHVPFVRASPEAHAAPDPAVATYAPAPHFAIELPSAPAANGALSDGPAALVDLGPASAAAAAVREPIAENQVDEPARCKTKPTLLYPAAAEQAGVEADVALEIVVDESGRVTSAKPLARTGYGLDAAAETGVRAYRFSPAKKNGKNVTVRMTYVVKFELH